MVPATRKFADRSPFFQLREHFQQGAVVRFLHMEAATDILGGGWICPNLQKTKYVIGAQVRRARHRLGPASGNSGRGGFYSFFFGERETFFGGMGLHTQANTRPAARPPSGQSDIPRKGNLGGGTTWPASPFYLQQNQLLDQQNLAHTVCAFWWGSMATGEVTRFVCEFRVPSDFYFCETTKVPGYRDGCPPEM